MTAIFILILNGFIPCALADRPDAPKPTIFESSILWDDVANRNKLLTTVPKWPLDVMQSLFEVFSHPEQYLIPRATNRSQYHLRFINHFWGALENPFNKYPRPSKLFLFLSSDTYEMVPVIRTTAGNYFIFSKDQKNPIPLNMWVTDLMSTRGITVPLRFNICNKYGNFPSDVCDGKSYHEENIDAYKTTLTKLSDAYRPLSAISAVRPFDEDWQITRAKKSRSIDDDNKANIFAESISWVDLTARTKLLKNANAWLNYKLIYVNYKLIRDLRYFHEENNATFYRRITWLYPDDGCWTRASAVIKDFFGPINNIVNQFTRPSKIFVFGNLCVNTLNHKNGKVTWWYHTAPVIKDSETNQTYVLDPSVDPYQPVRTEDWVRLITSRTGACTGSRSTIDKFNICNGYGSNPYDFCQNIALVNVTNEMYSMLSQIWFRPLERQRQSELGFDPNKTLGNEPPWNNPTIH